METRIEEIKEKSDILKYEKVINSLLKEVKYKSKKRKGGKKFYNCFSTKSFIKFCENKYPTIFNNDLDKIKKFGKLLLESNIIYPISYTGGFREKKFYKFYIHKNEKKIENILNVNKIFLGNKNVENAESISQEIRTILTKLYGKFLIDGKVDYKGIKESELYQDYLNTILKLQIVNIEDLTTNEKKSFFINIYNSLVIHGHIEKGIPTNFISKNNFFIINKYLIDNELYSLNDIEHGILRGNRKKPYILSKQFKIKSLCLNERKLKNIINEIDPRIHFSLNCGSLSCPPIRCYESSDLDYQLNIATYNFVESEVKKINDSKISISQLFLWYSKDFGTKKDILKFIEKYTENEDLKKIVSNPKTKIMYHKYDWSHNGK